MVPVGTVFKHTFAIDEKVYMGFKSVFRDENPLHTDSSFAIGKGFKGCLMYGNILSGFLSYFVGELLPFKNVIIQSQSINFTNPVYLNDTITLEAKVYDFYESVNCTEIKYKFTNQTGVTIAKGMIQIGTI